jgi:hypothetical protein
MTMLITDPAPASEFSLPASASAIDQAVTAVRARGIKVQQVDTAAQALAKVHELIPAGATIMSGLSQTIQEIGLEAELINKQHPWVNLKDDILAETDPAAQNALRIKSTLSPWYLGSVHAIAQTGEIVVGSGTGSQLPAYAYSSPNILWIAGVQKIVPTLEDGLRRLREYSLPLEHIRMRAYGFPGAMLSKILIIEQEPEALGRNVHLILVNQPIGA